MVAGGSGRVPKCRSPLPPALGYVPLVALTTRFLALRPVMASAHLLPILRFSALSPEVLYWSKFARNCQMKIGHKAL